MFKLKLVDKVSFFMVILGAFNWGAIGIFNKNFLFMMVGGSEILIRTIYVLLLLSAVDLLYLLFKANIIKISGDKTT